MANGPQRLILINAGRYDYAELELGGSLQIVGPNNTGKTTLINTLQFLYLDDRRKMEFGSYSPEQTRDYYFPNQYSYVMFEVLGARGKCVLGWRGHSRVVGGEPERFLFDGPFEPRDFLDPSNNVREPKDVNARLSLKQYLPIKNAQEQREILLLATKGDAKGIGLVALRDNDRYPQFRETLKNLLCLSTISQEQMRGQLLMLAGLPADGCALDVRELFGDDYDHILRRKEKLLRFKKHQSHVEMVVANGARRESLRNELAYRWRDMLPKRQAFEREHIRTLEALRSSAETTTQRILELDVELRSYRLQKEALSERRGSLLNELDQIAKQATEFADFMEQWARTTLENMKGAVRVLERQLEDSESEAREKVEQRLQRCRELTERSRRTITHFDRALIGFLRRELTEDQLASLSTLFDSTILEQPVGDDAVVIRRPGEFIQTLRLLGERIQSGVYRDENIDLPLPSAHNPKGLVSVADLRERLTEEEQNLKRLESTLVAIEQRERLLKELAAKREEIDGSKDSRGDYITEGIARQLFRFEEYKKAITHKPELVAELKQTDDALARHEHLIEEALRQVELARTEESRLKERANVEQTQFRSQIQIFADCSAPTFQVEATPLAISFPSDFAATVDEYLQVQNSLRDVNREIGEALRYLEAALGPDYAGFDECETIRLLGEELEALSEREDVLRREWEHQITSLRATFDDVLKSIQDIKSAADRLNRDLSNIQISNLAALRMEVLEQTEIVGSMRRLAKIEQPGLFEESTGLEATVAAFRRKFESTPLLRYPDLFTLRFTVTGDDGKPHHYHDFRQVESHGTTITIKVLFNLLVLRSLLREDTQRKLLCEIPFFLDEIHSLDAVNRHAILATARNLGFIAITAAPESVSEVDALYFLQPHQGRIVLKTRHRMRVIVRQRET